MRILLVCLGNICRSPAAEAVLVRALRESGIDRVEVSSAGTADYHVGERPHELSVAEGQARGYAFTTRGEQLTAELLERADLVLAMDVGNERDVLALARTARDRAKVVRLGAFAPGATGTPRDVPDPWGQEAPAYAAMYDQVEEAVAGLVAAIRTGSVAQVLQAHGHPSPAGA